MATFTCPVCGEGNLAELHNEFVLCLGCGTKTPLPGNPNPHPNPSMSEETYSDPLPAPQLQVNEGSEAPPDINSPAEGPLPGTPLFPDFNPPSPLSSVGNGNPDHQSAPDQTTDEGEKVQVGSKSESKSTSKSEKSEKGGEA